MKRFYVTKKQANKFIDSKLSLFNGKLNPMLSAVDSTLVYLDSNEGDNYNKAQIKFYSRIKARLTNMMEESSAKNKQC